MTREEMIERLTTGVWQQPEVAAKLQADGETIARMEAIIDGSIERLRARIAELEAVLPPFSAWSEKIEAEFSDHDDDVIAASSGGALVTFGDLRRLARAALRSADKGEAP